METKFLFENYIIDKRGYNLNEGYWARNLKYKLRLKVSEDTKLFKNVDAEGIKFYDGNPIFTYINEEKTKGVRLIQPSKEDLVNYRKDKSYSIFAYLDRIFYMENKEIEELVIVITPTKKTVEKSLQLISAWLENKLTKEMIEE